MEKNMSGLAIILVILCLIIGGTTGYVMKDAKVVYEDKIVEVPVEVEVVKEVEKIVEVFTIDTQPLLDTAIADFLEEVEDDRTLQYCGIDELSERYDEDQIKVRNIEDEYSIIYNKDDEDGFGVVFNVELKYLDKDVEEKCYVDYNVEAYYEDGEDVEITILE